MLIFTPTQIQRIKNMQKWENVGIEPDEFRYEYYETNVYHYAKAHKVSYSQASLELNRMMGDTWDDFSLEFIKKEKDAMKKKWFLLGYVIGSVVVAALLQIF